jgi:hypothetical protein
MDEYEYEDEEEEKGWCSMMSFSGGGCFGTIASR